jgi:hypothetical protein
MHTKVFAPDLLVLLIVLQAAPSFTAADAVGIAVTSRRADARAIVFLMAEI